MKVSPVVEALIAVFEEQKPRYLDGSRFAVSRTVSLLAALYEKARNAVEFRAEHLIRRASIERILKRRILLNGGSQSLADNLIVELMWARYIDSSQVDDKKVAQIQAIIDKYIALRHHAFTGHKHADMSWDLVLGIASSEIDEVIVPAERRQALVNFFYQAVRPKVLVPEKDEKLLNVMIYIAVERAYAQADDPLVYFHVLSVIHPEWQELHADKIHEIYPGFRETLLLVREAMKDSMLEQVFRFVRRETPPFLLLRDFFYESGTGVRALIENQQELERKLAELAQKRYQEISAKVRRSVIRSVIYIFLTKMVFALALEAPFDLLIVKRVEYFPLLVNLIFPPILLYAVAGFISVPGSENTARLIGRITKILYDFDEIKNEKEVFVPKSGERRPFLTAVFSLLYLGTFAVSFGLISFVLTRFHFNIASQLIFVFFVTLVSFFAYRIRLNAKEYDMSDRQGFLGPVVDFFFLPILRVGHLLSAEIAKLNIFIIIFDFILEAPLKVIFEVLEEWIRFIRTKKEEIL